FDLFATPINQNFPRFPQAPRNVGLSLSSLQNITHKISVQPNVVATTDNNCKTTRSALLTAVVLTNSKEHQTFFYQVRLGSYQSENGLQASGMPRAAWFFKGSNLQSGGSRQYGYGDNITFFGQTPATLNSTSNFSIELLPRLKELI